MKRVKVFTNTKKYTSISVIDERRNFFSTRTLNTRIEKLYPLKNINGLGETSWKLNTEKGSRVSLTGTAFMRALQTAKEKSLEKIVWFQYGVECLPDFKCNNSYEGHDKPFSVVSSVINLPMADIVFDFNPIYTIAGINVSTIYKEPVSSTFLTTKLHPEKIIRLTLPCFQINTITS